MVGYKYKMSNLQAAIGCAQMERIEDLIEGKRRVFKCYSAALSDLPLSMNPEPDGIKNGCWMPTVVVDKGVTFDLESLLSAFRSDHIDGRVFFWPLSMLPMFTGQPGNNISYGLYSRAVNLPSYHDLTEKEMSRA